MSDDKYDIEQWNQVNHVQGFNYLNFWRVQELFLDSETWTH